MSDQLEPEEGYLWVIDVDAAQTLHSPNSASIPSQIIQIRAIGSVLQT